MNLRQLSLGLLFAYAAASALAQTGDSEPAVPSDPRELVTGEAQVVSTPEARAQILQMLDRARALSNVRADYYDLKSTITSLGSGANEGSWQMEDISPAEGVYRWTVEGPSYSAVNLYSGRLLYSNRPAGTAPLRLQQVRTAIFFAFLGPRLLNNAVVRTASASLNGREATCALLSGRNSPAADRGRLWEETEYCIDRASGLLLTYSAAPGSYVIYDYSKVLRLNGAVVPGKISITEAGSPSVEAQLTSLTVPASASPAEFAPSSGMTATGAGPLMAAPLRFPVYVRQVQTKGSDPLIAQPVIVHGLMTPQGHIVETEIAQTSNPGLNQQALDVVGRWQGDDRVAPGATPIQREVFVNVKFVAP